MIRVVLDTNVVVSAILNTGPSKTIFDLAVNDRFAWFVSKPILAEYRRVLTYPRLRLAPASLRRTMAKVKKHGRLISPGFKLEEAPDEPDNRFLECAQEAKANFLVTGNLRHFPNRWKYTKIVTPVGFLVRWPIERPLHGA